MAIFKLRIELFLRMDIKKLIIIKSNIFPMNNDRDRSIFFMKLSDEEDKNNNDV